MKEERAGVIVEMAIIAPVLALMLLGFIQIGLIVIAKIGIHNAATVSARFATLDGATTQAQVENTAKQSLPPTIAPADVNVNYDPAYLTTSGTAIKVTLEYDMPLIVPYVVPNSSGGVLPIEATSIMR